MREYKSKEESKDLFDSFSGESEGEEEGKVFQVNKKYAKEFNERKQREELARYSKDEGIDSSDSEDEEEEDEYAQLLTPQLDIQIFKAINAIRRNDERIYDPNLKLFDDSNNSAAHLQKDDGYDNGRKNKRVHYKDVIRDQILEQMEIDRDGSDDEDKQRIASTSSVGAVHKLAYDEEQRHIRDSFLKSSGAQDKTDDDDNDSILVMKPNNKVSINILDPQEEEMLRQEIETLLEHGDNHSTFQDPRGEISDGNNFLQEYLLQRKWIDKSELFLLDDDEREEESPDKKIGNVNNDIDSGPKKTKKSSSSAAIAGTDTNGVCDQDNDESSLEELERMEEFESKYNFRFEEAFAENDTSRYQIVSYARGKPIDSLRRNDDARKQKRLQREERKLAERKAKEEQLRRLKNAKKAELQEKISKIRSICGSSNGQNTLDEETLAKLMDEEFDPDKFSKIMDEAYGEDFYGEEDIAWKSDKDVKQSMAKDNVDLSLEGEYYDYDNEDLHYDDNDDDKDDEGRKDDDDMYDAEIEEDYFYAEEELEENPLDRQLKQKMLDELYKLDYEDIIGDMPCRFKYRRVEPNSYGLSCEEILFANDTALKQFVSLKSMNPYRENSEYYVSSKKRKKFREMLKDDYGKFLKENEVKGKKSVKSATSGAGAESNDSAAGINDSEKVKKKRRRQKKGSNMSKVTVAATEETNPGQNQVLAEPKSTTKVLKEKDVVASAPAEQVSTPNAISVNLESPAVSKKKKRKRKKGKLANTSANPPTLEGVSAARLSSYGIV